MKSAFRFIVFLIAASFFLVRQIYVNLLHVDKALVSAFFVLAMAVTGVMLLVRRLKIYKPSFFWIDLLLATQICIAGIAIVLYAMAGKVTATEGVYALYYHCFAPLLIYVGFYAETASKKRMREWTAAISVIFVVMIIVSVLQVCGIDWWVFRNENWQFIKTFFGIPRATAGFGTQIDFGLLCFIFFVYSFYAYFESKSALSAGMACLAFVGIILTFSRMFIFAGMAVFFVQFVRPSVLASIRQKGKVLVSVALLLVLIGVAFNELNILAIFKAEDAITQDSNDSRISFVEKLPRWLLQDYAYIGVGPGTQNGPNDTDTKLVGDFLWLGLLLEFGTLTGSILVMLKVLLLCVILFSYLRSESNALATSAFALTLSFALVSFINSSFANMTTISVFYLFIGKYYFEYQKRSSESRGSLPIPVYGVS